MSKSRTERKEEVSMLKIRSFLRQTNDSIMNFIKKMLQRYSRHMAATAYGLSAVILVFHFGNLADITVNASNQFEATMNYKSVSPKSEETIASELIWSDTTEYALISPDNHILQTITETVDELPRDMTYHIATKQDPLGQLSISPVTSEESWNEVTLAILALQEDLLLTTNQREQVLETLALSQNILVENVDSTESKVETTKARISVTESNEEIKDEALNDETLSSDSLSSGTRNNIEVSTEVRKDNKEQGKTSEEINKEVKTEVSKENKEKSQTSKETNNDVKKAASKASNKDSSNETKEEAKEALSVSDSSIPSNLTLTMNKAMKLSLSEKEIEVLQRIVEAEASGEDIYGKILVANVVINRVNSEEFPDTISDVVFQKNGSTYQFSPTRDGRYWSVKISKETIKAVDRALSGEDYSEGALYFFARRLTSNKKAKWFDSALEKVVQYGCHEFFKD